MMPRCMWCGKPVSRLGRGPAEPANYCRKNELCVKKAKAWDDYLAGRRKKKPEGPLERSERERGAVRDRLDERPDSGRK